jgi:hypothetical protein
VRCLDRNSGGEEDRVEPNCLIRLSPLDGFVEIGDRQHAGASAMTRFLSWHADIAAFIARTPSSIELKIDLPLWP